MSITWQFEGTIIDAKYKEISVTATMTDDSNPDPPVVVELDRVSVQTNANKLRALDEVYAKAQVELQRRITDAAFQEEINTLEAQAKDNLEARDN